MTRYLCRIVQLTVWELPALKIIFKACMLPCWSAQWSPKISISRYLRLLAIPSRMRTAEHCHSIYTLYIIGNQHPCVCSTYRMPACLLDFGILWPDKRPWEDGQNATVWLVARSIGLSAHPGNSPQVTIAVEYIHHPNHHLPIFPNRVRGAKHS